MSDGITYSIETRRKRWITSKYANDAKHPFTMVCEIWVSSPATRWLISKLVANKVMMSMPWMYGLDGELASYQIVAY